MKLREYVELAKQEIENMALDYEAQNLRDPDLWPLENERAEWGEQELAMRF